jgi:hypothetical protein
VLLSLILPVIKIPDWSTSDPKVIKVFSAINPDVFAKAATGNQSSLPDRNQLALYAFLIITAIGFFIMISQVAKIILLVRDNPKEVRNNVHFVFPKDPRSPFSFFKYIFWDTNIDIDSKEGQMILQHELTHVQQYHTADKLLLSTVLAAFWANPIFWMIRKELNMLHEFLADQKAITNADTNAFATMLLTASYSQHSFVLNNSFFHSPVKRRLLMITASKNTRFTYFRRFMVLPLFGVISIISAFKIDKRNSGALQKGYGSINTIEAAENGISASVNNSDTIEAKFPGGDDAWKKYLETNLDANAPVVKDKAPAGIYTVKVQFIVTENGEIKDVAATQSPDGCPSCAIEAVRIIKSGPKWEPMTIDGKKVTSRPIQFISFKVEEE